MAPEFLKYGPAKPAVDEKKHKGPQAPITPPFKASTTYASVHNVGCIDAYRELLVVRGTCYYRDGPQSSALGTICLPSTSPPTPSHCSIINLQSYTRALITTAPNAALVHDLEYL